MRIPATAFFILLLAMMPTRATGADIAEFRIHAGWDVGLIEGQVPFTPRIEPYGVAELSDLGSTFDGATGSWVFRTSPLKEELTNFHFQVTSRQGENPAHPEIAVSIPRDEKSYPIAVPLLSEPPVRAVLDVYRNGISANLAAADRDQKWLQAFLNSEYLLRYLISGEDVGTVNVGAAMARTLTVYSDSVVYLASNTEWFGIPQNLNERIRLIDRIESEANLDKGLRKQINLDRLVATSTKLRSTPYHMYSRLWEYVIESSPVECEKRYSASLFLHDRMRKMTNSEYDTLRSEIHIDRATALNEAIRCFRNMMSVDDQARYFLDFVVQDDFKGAGVLETLGHLKESAEHELSDRGPAVWTAARAGDCNALDDRPTSTLCSSYQFLVEITGLLEEEPREYVRVSQ